ncbi:hypothetical protein AB0M43_38205 [Longispora sp. NPDC051575]|uniref:hypothetical protein n=1 Tax=Longispora sp. NPDC051575 TaxID=3154943 RepID=UPI003419AC82
MTSARPERWLRVLAGVLAGLGVVILISCGPFALGLSAMGTDTCTGDAPCPAADAIDRAFTGSVAATGLGVLIVLVLLFAPRRWIWAPVVQVVAGVLALCGGLYPLAWLFAGGPHP